MKRILFLIPALAILAACGSPNDLDREGVKGKVKSISEHQYKATYKNGKWVPGEVIITGYMIINYDRDGFKSDTYFLDENSDTLGYMKYTIKEGETVEESFYSYTIKMTTRTLLERVSDKQVDFETWEGDRMQYQGTRYYNSMGRMEKEIRLTGDVELINYYTYEKDQLTENYLEDPDGNRTYYQSYTYEEFDDAGNWTVKATYMGEEKMTPDVITTREYTYY
jgi:hypothetical protein